MVDVDQKYGTSLFLNCVGFEVDFTKRDSLEKVQNFVPSYEGSSNNQHTTCFWRRIDTYTKH